MLQVRQQRDIGRSRNGLWAGSYAVNRQTLAPPAPGDGFSAEEPTKQADAPTCLSISL